MKLSTRDADGIATAISKGEKFETHGSLKGGPVLGGAYHTGRLPSPYVDSVRDGLCDYVIYSYATPIAWRTEGRWEIPAEKYSVTTSKQQGTVHRALRMLDDYPRVINGQTVWACCESTIGPVCGHKSA
jgi:hypothetical protein